MRVIKAVGVLFGAAVAACTGSGAPTEELGQAKDELASTIVVSDAVAAEDPVYNNEPYGWYTLASTPNSHLIVTQSPAPVLGGYAAVAFVVRGSRIVNEHGTLLDQPVPFSPADNAAAFSGTHWLIVLGRSLCVLDKDGALVSATTLPFDARAIVWGTDRALVVGASPDSPYGSGPNQGLFVNAKGRPSGAPFALVAGVTQLKSGLAFDGSRFLLEYSTLDAVSAVAISTSGDIGNPVELATLPPDQFTDAEANGVLSDGRGFLVSYLGTTDPGLRYRMIRANAHLDLVVDDEQVSGELFAGTPGAFIEGRYVFLDDFEHVLVAISPNGKRVDVTTSYAPFGDDDPEYALSAAPDGTNPMLVDFVDLVTNVSPKLAPIGKQVQVGLGPSEEFPVAAVFNGADFTLEWADYGRVSWRGEHVAADGSSATPAVALGAPVDGGQLASNGSSVLRVDQSQAQALLTFPHDTTTTIDLSPYLLSNGYPPAVGSNGTDYVVVSADGSQAKATRLSSTGAIAGTSSFVAAVPLVGYDGAKYVVASTKNAYHPETGTWDVAITFTPLSLDDITPGPTVTLPLIADTPYTNEASFTGGDAQSLLAWTRDEEDGYRHVYCSRVSSDLALLDAPGVPLGQTDINAGPPAVAWDGSTYWLAWTASGSGAPAIRRVSPQPVNGSILREAEPFIAAGPALGQAVLSSRPGGPTLLFASPPVFGAPTWRLLSQ